MNTTANATAPAHLVAAAEALEAAGCQVDLTEFNGLAWFTVALADEDVPELQVGTHPIIEGALTVSASRRHHVVPVWIETMRDVETLVASFQFWNDGVASALEPMMELAADELG